MEPFNIAIIGCGGVSRMHFDAYLAHPERVNIAAVCDPDSERLARVRQEYGIENVSLSLYGAIEAADWDVAVICTPTPVRTEVALPLAHAGKHLFVEKPLSDSYIEAEDIVAACEGMGVKLAVDQNFRYHYPFAIARDLIQEGRLGKVLSVVHRNLMFRQDSGWRTRCSRHALSVMGVHWLDGFRWILQQEAESILCRIHSSPAIDCAGDTDAAVQLTFREGTAVSYVQSFSSPISKTETLIIGEAAALSLDHRGAALFDRDHRDEPAERWDISADRKQKSEATFQSLNQLLTALEQGTEPDTAARTT